jgi:hypothetical protein
VNVSVERTLLHKAFLVVKGEDRAMPDLDYEHQTLVDSSQMCPALLLLNAEQPVLFYFYLDLMSFPRSLGPAV